MQIIANDLEMNRLGINSAAISHGFVNLSAKLVNALAFSVCVCRYVCAPSAYMWYVRVIKITKDGITRTQTRLEM